MPTSPLNTVISLYLRKKEHIYLKKLASLRGQTLSSMLLELVFDRIDALHERKALYPGQKHE